MTPEQIKSTVTMEMVMAHYDSVQKGNRWRCLKSENHNNSDTNPSATIQNDRLTCHSQGCFQGDDIFTVTGKMEGRSSFKDQKAKIEEQFRLNGHQTTKKKIVATYDYMNAEGQLLFQTVRYDPKDFKQRRPDGRGGWIWNLKDIELSLYVLPKVMQADSVLILEGEKDVKTAYDLGLPEGWAATCNPMGAENWRDHYSESLRGKDVVVCPDRDEPGQRHGELVAQRLQGIAKEIRWLGLPSGKDLTEWVEAGVTPEIFPDLLLQAEEWKPFTASNHSHAPESVWAKAQPVADFISKEDAEVDWLHEPLLAPGAITEIFSPRGIGKTQLAYWLGLTLARQHKRVLLLNRDNPTREVKRRLKAFGGHDIQTMRVMNRDEAPSLMDKTAWSSFPVKDYDLVIVDSLDASAEGIGEKDSAKPSKALVPLLDIAHQTNGPAILILGNTIKSSEHSRGSGVIEDRADICFEVRDATDFQPSGEKDWWLELPKQSASDFGERAARRKKRSLFHLAFIPSKFRLGEEPEPFIFELNLAEIPWEVRNVTDQVVQGSKEAREAEIQSKEMQQEKALQSLAMRVRERYWQRDPICKKDAVPILVNLGIKRDAARQLVDDQNGKLWRLEKCLKKRGNPLILIPLLSPPSQSEHSRGNNTQSKTPLSTEVRETPISADRMDTAPRKSDTREAVPAEEIVNPALFPRTVCEQEQEVIDLVD